MEKSRNISYAEAAARDNSIFTVWTTKWGIHVRPWYSADKLKFSFIEVGQSGKGNSFDIYMDIVKFGSSCFKKWSNDILSPTGRFENIMKSEAEAGEQYPKYYKFITGSDGSKTIGICNSRKGGYVINAAITKDGKKIFANVPVDFGDLSLLAENFKRSYEAREAELVKIRVEAEKAISAHYTDPDAFDETSNRAINLKDISSDSTNNTDTAKIVPMRVRISMPVKREGEFVFEGITCDTKERVELFVTNAVLKGEQREQWELLNDMLKKDIVTITFNVIDADRIDIVGIAA